MSGTINGWVSRLAVKRCTAEDVLGRNEKEKEGSEGAEEEECRGMMPPVDVCLGGAKKAVMMRRYVSTRRASKFW